MTLDCDDSCVEIYIKRHGMVMDGDFVLGDFARTLERRAIAAEARVKELEVANAELIERLQERVESYLAASKRDVQTIQQQAVELARLRSVEARVKELEAANDALQRSKEWYEREAIRQTAAKEYYERQLSAALRLRPIAEAGPVPKGMVRVYAESYLNEEWLFAEKPCESDTHFIDIYPPQQ